MAPDDEYLTEKQFENFERARRFSQPYIDRAGKIYAQSLSGLWLGNAGAAIAMLGLIGGIAKDRPDIVQRLLWPLSLFVLGLIALGIGAGASLIQQGALARRMEEIDSILNVRMQDIKRPTEMAGLSFRDWRTITGCLAAILFVAGCLLGLTSFFKVG